MLLLLCGSYLAPKELCNVVQMGGLSLYPRNALFRLRPISAFWHDCFIDMQGTNFSKQLGNTLLFFYGVWESSWMDSPNLQSLQFVVGTIYLAMAFFFSENEQNAPPYIHVSLSNLFSVFFRSHFFYPLPSENLWTRESGRRPLGSG